MRRSSTLRTTCFAILCAAALGPAVPAGADATAQGTVCLDENGNGVCDAGERGLPKVGVSNGRDVVVTDEKGQYALAVDDDDIVFVIKPRNYMTPVSDRNLPRFHSIHKPKGSPEGLKHPGVAPTGPLPKSIDFALRPQVEADQFDIVVFGDTQPSRAENIDHLAHDVLAEVIGTSAAFGVTLGDIVSNHLNLFEPYTAVMSTVGIPWYNVMGNHDENYDVSTDELADETGERVFGPATYSFNWGPVHFIVLDDVAYEGQEKEQKYHSELGRHLTFVENDLKLVPRDQLVVLMMHIPIIETRDRNRLFDLLQDRPHTFSLSAHWHRQKHVFLGAADGWKGDRPHHHLVHGAVCGSWWLGAPDEFGLPHATMSDGTPNGYSIITFSGTDYRVRYKAARRPADEQMSICAPSVVKQADAAETEILVNVYAGSERSKVEARVGNCPWTPLERVERVDPYFAAVKASEKRKSPPNGRPLPAPAKCQHLWMTKLPSGLAPGTYVIEVRTTDVFGQTYTARRVLRVE